MYVTGIPKTESALLNNNNNGALNAMSRNMESITSFCSCRFFMVLY